MIKENNLNLVIEAVNKIELSRNDLLEIVLKSSKAIMVFHKEEAIFIDRLFGSGNFMHACLEAARESLILGMQTLLLKNSFHFESLVKGCYNTYSKEDFIKKVSEDEETKEFLKKYFSELSMEIFTSTISRNKDLKQISSINKEIIEDRIEIFKNHVIFM